MNNNLKKFAPLAFYVAIATGIITVLFWMIWEKVNVQFIISAVVFVLSLAAGIVFDFSAVKNMLKGRQAKYGGNSALLIIGVIGILVVVNLFVYQAALRWDLTDEKLNTLADETLQVLKSLPDQVKATAFYSNAINSAQARSLLNNYKSNGKGNFDYEFIDPTVDQIAAVNAEITQDGTIVLALDGRVEYVTSVTEENITLAMIKLINPKERTVYFLTGHEELSINDTGESGITQLKESLTRKNYKVLEINLFVEEFPENAVALVIAGPVKALSADEISRLDAYITQGGALVVLYDPSAQTSIDNENDPFISYMQENWGISFNNDLILDQMAENISMAVAQNFGSHAITRDLKSSLAFFPLSRSIAVAAADGVTTTELASSSEYSWAEINLEGLKSGEVANDPGEDTTGPIPLAYAVEYAKTGSRMVVIGDSDFAANQFYASYDNGTFILNAIDWAAMQENLINIAPKTATTRYLVPPTKAVANVIRIGSIAGIPMFIIITGIIVAIIRKREA